MTRDAVTILRARGFALCKPDRGEKKPTYKGWSIRSLETADFAHDDLVGIMGGPLSTGGLPGHALVIIDLDSPAAVEKADDFLPFTGTIEGRASKPRSHRYYLTPLDSIPEWGKSTAQQAAPAAVKAAGHPGPFLKHFRREHDGENVLDFLGTGGQAVAPPSSHPSGERREWVIEEEGREPDELPGPGIPAAIPFLDLWNAVCRLAVECGAKLPTTNAPTEPKNGSTTRRRKNFFTVPSETEGRAMKYLEKMEPSIAGQAGHDRCYAAACVVVWGFDLGPEVGFRLLKDYFNSRCKPEWSEAELRHKVNDADLATDHKHPRGHLRDAQLPDQDGTKANDGSNAKSADDGKPFELTDVGAGRRFAARFGNDVRFAADREAWFAWDTKRWAADTSQVWIEAMGKKLAREWAGEAATAVAAAAKAVAEAGDDDATAAANKQLAAARAELTAAKKLQDMRYLRRMLAAARSEPGILIVSYRDTFDRDPWAMNCPNGTVNLTCGELKPHCREDYLTRLCPVPFDPKATAPSYGRFVRSIFAEDADLVSYVRRLSGVIVTGDVSSQTLHLFFGTGSNGKSVLLETWLRILGGDGDGYGLKMPDQALVSEDKASRHPTEIADLAGARLAVASETRQGGRLDESRVKELTGGDTVTARKMRENFFRFDPTHKLVIATNHKPRIAGTDHGIWRRVRLVPFGVRFWKDADRITDPLLSFDPTLKADLALPEKLRAEAEGILAEMVREAVAFAKSGRDLTPPKVVTVATNEYRQGEDTLGQFFGERIRPDREGGVQAKALYAAYKEWAEAMNYKPVGNRTFSDYAKARFGQNKSHGVIVYQVRLVEPGTQTDAQEAA